MGGMEERHEIQPEERRASKFCSAVLIVTGTIIALRSYYELESPFSLWFAALVGIPMIGCGVYQWRLARFVGRR
jgi:hypothetical protein